MAIDGLDPKWAETGAANYAAKRLKGKDTEVIVDGGIVPIKKNPNHLTVHQLRGCAPIGIHKHITEDMMKVVNASIDDCEIREEYRENILTWINVVSEGRFKMQDYVNACKYVTYKLMGDTNIMAWTKVFPERYQRLVDKGIPSKNISSHSTAYSKRDLVIKIMGRTLAPIHIVNADILQEAINSQVTLMRTAHSETVRQKAGATLIENLKPPEELKVTLDVGVSNSTIEDLRAVTGALALEQMKAIEDGRKTVGQIAEMDIVKKREEDVVEAEYDEMEPEKISRLDPISSFMK